MTGFRGVLKITVPLMAVFFMVCGTQTSMAFSPKKFNIPKKGDASSGGEGLSGAALDEAKGNYQLYCVMCHGNEGKGDGQLAPTLDIPPANHTDPERMSKASDERLFKTISQGGASVGLSESMPPHNTTLSEEQIRGLVKYLRVLCGCQYKG